MIPQACLDLIKKYEGFKDKAYLCPAGVWTLGWGSTNFPNGTPVKEGDICTLEEAESYLAHHIETEICPKLNDFLKRNNLKLNDNQMSALISFAYNLGLAPIIQGGKALNAALLHLDDAKVKKAMLLYDKAGGKTLAGLTKRRKEEADLYLS